MAYKAFSDEWAQAYKNEINNSAIYKQAAAGWEGVVALIVEAEPEKNFPETKGVWMDLWHGEARDIKIVDEGEADKADFVIRGPYFPVEAGGPEGARLHQGDDAGQAQAQGRPADNRPLHQGQPGNDGVHDPR